MTEKTIEQLYKDFKELTYFLDKRKEISLHSVVNENFRKVLLLAIASYFEKCSHSAPGIFLKAIKNFICIMENSAVTDN